MPKTTSTPTRSRANTRAWAPVTRTGTWYGRDAAGACCAVPCCCAASGGVRPPGCEVAGRGGAGLAAPVLAGMSSGEGACALEGAGLLCSVIGWLPCQVCAQAVKALKNPSCRVAVEGRAQELDWSALCAPAKYENVVPLHEYQPHPQAGLPSNYNAACLTIRDGLSGNSWLVT